MPPQITTFGFITLTESVNKIVVPNTFVRSTVFNRRVTTAATKTIQVDIIVGSRKIAPFVKRGNPATMLTQVGQKTSLVEPPSIRMKKYLTPEDLLFSRAPGQSMYVVGSGNGDPIAQARLEKIGLEQMDMKMRATRSEEWMCCQALSSGGFTYKGSEFEFTIDYLMPAANKPTLAGNAKWNVSASATPIDDITNWKKQVKKLTGKLPTRAIMTSDVWLQFLASAQVQNYLNKWNIKLGEINTTADLQTMGAEKVARILNIDFYTYDEFYDDGQGNMTSMIGADKFILVCDAADYRFNYGAIEDLASGTVIGQYFSKDWIENDPSGYYMLVESHPLPTLNESESVISAKVL